MRPKKMLDMMLTCNGSQILAIYNGKSWRFSLKIGEIYYVIDSSKIFNWIYDPRKPNRKLFVGLKENELPAIFLKEYF